MTLTTTPEQLRQSDIAGVPSQAVRLVRSPGGEAELRSIDGRGLGFLSGIAADASITVGAEASNVIRVTVQLKDGNGDNLAVPGVVIWFLSTDAAGQTAPTAPNAGSASVTSNGRIIEWTAEVSGIAISNASGVLAIDVSDTGTPTFYLNIILAGHRRVVSGAITFA